MSSSIIKVGIIGTGGMGLQHALDISTSSIATVTAIADVDQRRVEAAAAKLNSPKCYIDPLEMISDTKVDALVVASPDSTHAQYVLAALDLKKPILCEKPLASTIQEALRIVEKEVEIDKRLVSVGFHRRFDQTHMAIKETVVKGSYGLPLLWKGAHRNPSAMYDTDGPFILNNSAGHDVDSARWILGSSVTKVFAWGIKSREDLPDSAQDMLFIDMEMENGTRAIGEIYVNARYGYEVQAEVICQEGVVSSVPPQKVVVRQGGSIGTPISDDFRTYFIDSYKLEMDIWLQSILDGTTFSGASAYDGYCVMATTEAAGCSLRSGEIIPVKTIPKPVLYY